MCDAIGSFVAATQADRVHAPVLLLRSTMGPLGISPRNLRPFVVVVGRINLAGEVLETMSRRRSGASSRRYFFCRQPRTSVMEKHLRGSDAYVMALRDATVTSSPPASGAGCLYEGA